MVEVDGAHAKRPRGPGILLMTAQFMGELKGVAGI